MRIPSDRHDVRSRIVSSKNKTADRIETDRIRADRHRTENPDRIQKADRHRTDLKIRTADRIETDRIRTDRHRTENPNRIRTADRHRTGFFGKSGQNETRTVLLANVCPLQSNSWTIHLK